MRAAIKIITGRRRPPLDELVVPTGAYSLRRLLTLYKASKAARVVRASDSAEMDIGFTGDGKPDVATLTAFLSGTTGKVVTWYDQSGNGRDLTQATDANRPAIALRGLGPWPVLRTAAALEALATAGNITPSTGLMAFSAVANRTAGTGTCQLIRGNGGNNRLQTRNAAAGLSLVGGTSGTVVTSSADNAWHATAAVVNGASSVVSTDAVDTTGTATGNTTAGVISMGGANSTTCDHFEAVVWDNYDMPAAVRTALVNNQRAFGGF